MHCPEITLGQIHLLVAEGVQHDFSRRGTFQPTSQRKTLTVDQYHPLCALATLGFTRLWRPLLVGAKLPSRTHSSHCFSRRHQVGGEGNLSGRNRHAAPVCRIHRMPSKQTRFAAHGRPRLFRRCFDCENMGSNSVHCSSVNNFRRFFIAKFNS